MLKLTRSEESKLTSWYFEIDRKLLGGILLLIAVGLVTKVTAGSAQAARMSQPWFFFLKNSLVPYTLGIISLFFCSMLNKKQIIKISVFGIIVSIIALLITVLFPFAMNGSRRWANVFGIKFMPSDILKPFFIMITAWFLTQMHNVFGKNIFQNKNAWKLNLMSWWPYLIVFLACVSIIFWHPDVGTSALYIGVLFIMLFVAGFPYKWLPITIGVSGITFISIAFAFESHVKERGAHILDLPVNTQAWYSVNSIRHGGLFGSADKAFVKDVLPESTNDFVYSSISEDWGALAACGLVILFFLISHNLIKHAVRSKDPFVTYAISGCVALFFGQVCFNITTALHLVINKGMTLPFVSYGGISFIVFCILFGMILGLIREDTWNN